MAAVRGGLSLPVAWATGILPGFGARRAPAAFDPAAFLTTYPTARWWSPRQLEQDNASAISQIDDLSANEDHLVQATGAAQPTCTITDGIRRAVFGSDDYLQLPGAAPLDIGSVSKLTLVVAVRQTNSSPGAICEQNLPIGVAGGWGLYINNGDLGVGAIGAGIGTGDGVANSAYNFRNVNGVGAVPRNYVVTVVFDTTLSIADEISFMLDGISVPSVKASAAAEKNTVSGYLTSIGTFLVGRRSGGSIPFSSQLFDLVVIPGGCEDADLVDLSRHLFNECGF